MNRLTQFAGIVALVSLLFGVISLGLLNVDDYYVVPFHFAVGGILILVYLAGGGVRQLRSSSAKRAAGFGLATILYTALFFGVIGVVNFIVYKQELFRFDSTEEKVHTLAPQTTKLIGALEYPLTIRAFYVGGIIDDPKVEDLLNRMARSSRNLSWRLIDPEKSPTEIERFGINQNATLHFSYAVGDRPRESKIAREINEHEIVNAILKLTRGDAKKVYYLVGHGQPGLFDESEHGYIYLREAVEGENIKVEELPLAQAGRIPDEAAAVILAAPRVELLEVEKKILVDYLQNGGRALLLHEPRISLSILQLAKNFGIEIGQNVIVDEVIRMFEGRSLGVQPVVTRYGAHPVTANFGEATIFSIASSVQKGEVPEGATVTELAFTSEASWAETNIAELFSDEPMAEFGPEDIKGPVSVAAAYSKKFFDELEESDEIKETRLVVIGDADFVTNINIRQLYNRDFFLNALNWVVGEDEGITIRARTLRESTSAITGDQFGAMFLVSAILIPEVLLILGLGVWVSRRQ